MGKEKERAAKTEEKQRKAAQNGPKLGPSLAQGESDKDFHERKEKERLEREAREEEEEEEEEAEGNEEQSEETKSQLWGKLAKLKKAKSDLWDDEDLTRSMQAKIKDIEQRLDATRPLARRIRDAEWNVQQADERVERNVVHVQRAEESLQKAREHHGEATTELYLLQSEANKEQEEEEKQEDEDILARDQR